MTSKQVRDITGLGLSTVNKYGHILGVKYYGEGRRKIYEWTEINIEALKESIQKRGRKPKKAD